MTLGEKIKNLRNNNNISQEKLSKMLNINRNNLSRIETDKSAPTSDILYNLAKIFNISIDTLHEINKIEENSLQKKEKISKITKYCNNLSLQELDFLIKIIKSMHI